MDYFGYEPSPMLEGSPTGIVEFDNALQGGFPKGSVVLVAGSSGSGKTIFSFEWLFHGIREGENGLYITLTEPLFNTLKNLETMNFYDKEAVETETLKIVDMRDTVFDPKGFDYENILDYIEEEVKTSGAKRLVIDSITAIAYTINNKAHIRQFMFELGKILATLGCTTILTSEVAQEGSYSVYAVEEFISDVILRFDRIKEKNLILRKLSIVKVRGKETHIGELDFRINKNGIKMIPPLDVKMDGKSTNERVSIGNAAIDKLLYGGVLKSSSTMLAGTTGTGKSLLALTFIMDGLRKGEHCLYLGFEESRDQIVRNAAAFGWDLPSFERAGLLTIYCSYPHEKLLEEHLLDIRMLCESKGIMRAVVDSLSAVSNAFTKPSFLSFARRLNGYLKNKQITSIFTLVSSAGLSQSIVGDSQVSTLTDNLIMLRQVEMQGSLQPVMNIVKIRGSDHSKELIEYNINENGLQIGQNLSGFEGVLTGVTRKVDKTLEEKIYLEFKRFLGNIADVMFQKAKEKGLKGDILIDFIDDLIEQNILKSDQANFFKDNVKEIFGPNAFSDTRLNDPKTQQIISSFFEDHDTVNKNTFIKKYFGDKKKEK